MDHYGYLELGVGVGGHTLFMCMQDGDVVADRHLHDDDHRNRPFVPTMSTPEMADLLQREPGQDFE